MKKYYDVEDVQKITGFKKSYSYKIIRKINEKLKNENENENVVTFKGRVLIEEFNTFLGIDLKEKNKKVRI